MAYTDIDDPSTVFQTAIYTGTGSSNARTFGGNSDLSPDMLWFKNTGSTLNWMLWDTTRGITKYFYSNLNEGEGTTSSVLTAIGSDGFTVGNNNNVNESNKIIASYGWKKATGVFDIVSYTGNGSGRNISHSLGTVPGMMWVFNRDTNGRNRPVYFGDPTDYMYLSTNDARADYHEIWNDTAPTASVFSVGTDNGVNSNGEAYIAYLFGNKQGVSKVGFYTGNGNADGPFVYTGFKVGWVMIKLASGADNWQVLDNQRSPHNIVGGYLLPDGANVQINNDVVDFLSNGFKLRTTAGSWNPSGGTFSYIAFAENPFVTSTGISANAR